jgi:agmatine deiminase
MAWPTRRELWGGVFDEAIAEYAAVANAIGAFEPVVMVAAPGAGEQARALLGATVDVIELPIDDSWMRDSGPIFVVGANGEPTAVDFRFNSWGERFLPYDKDAAVTARVAEALGFARRASAMVLEGGSITVDGEGTLITTEQCLLHPNRNPGLTRTEIEAELRAQLGVEQIIWLPYGHADDAHTDGHVDGVCGFVAPGTVVVQSCEDEAHPDHARMRANRAVLEAARDARGRRLRIVELPFYPYFDVDGERTMVSYVNFYVANGGVVVPVADSPLDEPALAVLREAFPDREVVGVRAQVIAHGGGGIHCITQQVPA